MNEKKQVIKRLLLILVIIGIVSSSGYLFYDLVWIPFTVKKQNETFRVEETQQNSSQINSDNKNAPPVQKKYKNLKQQYEDFAGKLIIDGLEINCPVVQTTDNSYYLKHNIDGKEDKHGTLFADYRNNLSSFNKNTIIYGHNMHDGTRFGMLSMYKKLDTYKACPVITFNTIYKDYKWKVFAAFLINIEPHYDDGYVFNYLKTDFGSDNEFYDFYDEVMERSYFITDVEVTPEDEILTLSTCSLAMDNSRFVVMAKLVCDGEDEFVDTSAAEVNTRQRFPKAWQDRKGNTISQ